MMRKVLLNNFYEIKLRLESPNSSPRYLLNFQDLMVCVYGDMNLTDYKHF